MGTLDLATAGAVAVGTRRGRSGTLSPRGGGGTALIPFESLTNSIFKELPAGSKVAVIDEAIYFFQKFGS